MTKHPKNFVQVAKQYIDSWVEQCVVPSWNGGREAWILRTAADEKLVLRRVGKSRRRMEVALEHAMLRHLASGGFRYKVPEPLPTMSGQYMVELKDRLYWMYRYVEGEVRNVGWKEHFGQVAEAMARMHEEMERFVVGSGLEDLRAGIHWLMEDFERDLGRPGVGDEDAIRMYHVLLPNVVRHCRTIHLADMGGLQCMPLHYDWNTTNLLRKGRELEGIIDFGNCRIGVAVQDISVFLRTHCFIGLRYVDRRSVYFVEEYRKYRRLNWQEIALIPILMGWDAAEEFWWLANGKRFWEVQQDTSQRLVETARLLEWLVGERARILNSFEKGLN